MKDKIKVDNEINMSSSRTSNRRRKVTAMKNEYFVMGNINNKHNVNLKINPGSKDQQTHVLPNSLTIFHQNICGLKHKCSQLLVPLYQDSPHVSCIAESHMNK